jgi:hypothetical protein
MDRLPREVGLNKREDLLKVPQVAIKADRLAAEAVPNQGGLALNRTESGLQTFRSVLSIRPPACGELVESIRFTYVGIIA